VGELGWKRFIRRPPKIVETASAEAGFPRTGLLEDKRWGTRNHFEEKYACEGELLIRAYRDSRSFRSKG